VEKVEKVDPVVCSISGPCVDLECRCRRWSSSSFDDVASAAAASIKEEEEEEEDDEGMVVTAVVAEKVSDVVVAAGAGAGAEEEEEEGEGRGGGRMKRVPPKVLTAKPPPVRSLAVLTAFVGVEVDVRVVDEKVAEEEEAGGALMGASMGPCPTKTRGFGWFRSPVVLSFVVGVGAMEKEQPR